MTDRLLPSVDILTPEFKKKIDELEGDGKTLELRVTPSSEDVTVEQMQECAYRLIKNRKEGKYFTTTKMRYEENTEPKTIDEFLA